MNKKRNVFKMEIGKDDGVCPLVFNFLMTEDSLKVGLKLFGEKGGQQSKQSLLSCIY